MPPSNPIAPQQGQGGNKSIMGVGGTGTGAPQQVGMGGGGGMDMMQMLMLMDKMNKGGGGGLLSGLKPQGGAGSSPTSGGNPTGELGGIAGP